MARYTALAAALALTLLASSRALQCLDLPVATSGFEEWVGVVAKALSFGGRNQASSLQALKSFQASVAAKVQQQGAALKKLEKGDISDIIKQLLTQRIDISAPVFFDNAGGPDSLIKGSAAGVSFGFVGAQYAPCAIPITPIGVSVSPQGAIIGAQVFNIGPTGVNIQPQGVNISPNLIIIGPYDTTIAGQGLNIAPALIAIAPTRTVINPIGPLEISDTLVDAQVPLPPQPYTTLAAALVLAVLASSRVVQCLDLPVATSGFEEWAGVVAKAMSFGGRNQASSLQALKSFQASVAAKVQQQGVALKKLEKGDISDIIKQLLTQRIDISAPVFFDNAGGPDSLISGSAAGVSFGFVGAQYAPCAIPIAPLGVGVFPQGAIIQPQVLNIAPTGVNIQPQGVNIAPNLIVIGPYDTTVAGQGLNIAPALIAIAPTRTVINPIGPLEISDTLVDAEVPLPPGP